MAEDRFGAVGQSCRCLPATVFRTGETPEDFVLSIWRPGRECVETRPATFTDVDGLALFEGDIVLGTVDEVRLAISEGRGIGVTGPRFHWPGGVVPYVAELALRDRVEAAIADWHRQTPFRFQRRKVNDGDYLAFKSSPANVCQSRVGRQGGEQTVTLGNGCTVGATIHEIGHTVGLWHEQSRDDRDAFGSVVAANITPAARHNFDRPFVDDHDPGTYDDRSIMHYPPRTFSRSGKDTIIPWQEGVIVDQPDGLSGGDIAALKLLYPGLDWPAADEAAVPVAGIAALV